MGVVAAARMQLVFSSRMSLPPPSMMTYLMSAFALTALANCVGIGGICEPV
jgi:hypothetical protein